LSERKRVTARIVPPSPITVAIEDDIGNSVAYGVIADISGSGACVWTDADLAVGTTLFLRISFAEPPDVHEVVGEVVWSEPTSDADGRGSRRCGVEWLRATRACRERLRELAGRAARPVENEQYPFQVRWKVSPRSREV
jgi:Tfp pilus assembly protein PilZ